MNIAILGLDIISCLTVVFLSKRIFRSLKHPIFLICAWWSVFLLLSNVVIIGEGIHLGTHLIFLLFIYSILGFGIFFQSSPCTATFPLPKILVRHSTLWITISILIFLLSLWLGFVGYKLQGVYGSEFRALSFATGDYSSLLYGSYYLQVAADLVLSPLVLFGVIALPIAGIYYNKCKFLLSGFVLSVAASFQGSGRFHLYCFILATALAVIFVKRIKHMSRITLLAFVFAAIFVLAVISRQRLQAAEFTADVIENTIRQLVSYHVFGFYLFDYEFSDAASILHKETSFGRLTLFSYPDRIACMALRRFGINVSPIIDKFGEHWQSYVWLGDDRNGHSFVANAFYTSLYPLYYDFGYLGVVLVPGLFIYFLAWHYATYVRQNNITSLFVVIFLIIFFFTSIFSSKITSSEFLVIFICILLLNPVRKGFQTKICRQAGRSVSNRKSCK
ncbi:MAG: O-antigen ligase [Kiritimatiellae bacterium]|nr:O-antigen ligase [Kiritimatiellia bacterium]